MNARKRRIGDVIRLRRTPVVVDPFGTYEEIGVRSFGRGIFHKESVTGVELGNKRVFEIHPGDLVLSNVFAWEGAVALAGESERGRIGSHRFMTYVPVADEVDLSYLRSFFVSEPGLALLNRASPGSAGRNKTLAVDRFEALEMVLPDTDAQRRIAARLDSLFERIRAVEDVLRRQGELVTGLTHSLLNRAFADLQ
jgi:type I restriction enzyme S subunit